MSNAFAVTTPYVDRAGVGYLETHGALGFSPHSAVSTADPTAPTNHHLPQHRRQTSGVLPQWKGVPRIARPSPTDIASNGNSSARPGIQANKNKTQPDSQTVEPDYDEVLGVRDDSDAEARMRRLLNQLELVTQPDSRTIHEEDWASSSSSSLSQGVPPHANTQGPSPLTRAAFARQLGDSKETRDPVPLHDADGGSLQDDDILDYYTDARSSLSASGQSQFPNYPQNVTTRPPPPRHKSAPSTPNPTAVPPRPSRSPRRTATADERYSPANYAPSRKPSLVRGRYGGSEQNLHEPSRQNSRPAQPGHGIGRSNSSGAPFMNSPATPASSSPVLPGLVPDSISRSSSFASIQIRLVTPTDSTPPIPFGAPHPLGRIDEKPSLDYNEIEATKERQTVLSRTPSHVSGEVRERERIMERRPGLRLATPLPSTGWRTPTSMEHSSGRHLRSATTTTVASISDMGGMGSELSFGSSPRGFPRSTVSKGGVQRSYSRSGVSEFSSFTDTLNQSSGGMTNSMKEKVTPTVAAATAFAMSGTMPVGVAQSKAERAADKARQKAEKAAKKAEAALLKVELEREAKAQQEETKRAAAENKRQTVEARKREKDERQRQAELAMSRLLFAT